MHARADGPYVKGGRSEPITDEQESLRGVHSGGGPSEETDGRGGPRRVVKIPNWVSM